MGRFETEAPDRLFLRYATIASGGQVGDDVDAKFARTAFWRLKGLQWPESQAFNLSSGVYFKSFAVR